MCDQDTVIFHFNFGNGDLYIREFNKPYYLYCPCIICDPQKTKYDIFTRHICIQIYNENCELLFKLYNRIVNKEIIDKTINYIYIARNIYSFLESQILHNKFLIEQTRLKKPIYWNNVIIIGLDTNPSLKNFIKNEIKYFNKLNDIHNYVEKYSGNNVISIKIQNKDIIITLYVSSFNEKQDSNN